MSKERMVNDIEAFYEFLQSSPLLQMVNNRSQINKSLPPLPKDKQLSKKTKSPSDIELEAALKSIRI
jgi:hypothetical protein